MSSAKCAFQCTRTAVPAQRARVGARGFLDRNQRLKTAEFNRSGAALPARSPPSPARPPSPRPPLPTAEDGPHPARRPRVGQAREHLAGLHRRRHNRVRIAGEHMVRKGNSGHLVRDVLPTSDVQPGQASQAARDVRNISSTVRRAISGGRRCAVIFSTVWTADARSPQAARVAARSESLIGSGVGGDGARERQPSGKAPFPPCARQLRALSCRPSSDR